MKTRELNLSIRKSKIRFIYILSIIFFTTSCGVSQSDYDNLKSENEKLKKEIEDLKFGPDKLLSQAKLYLESKDFSKAKTELQNLIEKHYASQQATEGKQLLTIAENGIKEQKSSEEKALLEMQKAERNRLANATKKMRVKVDDMNDVTWYYDKTSPQFTNYNGFYAYIGTSKGSKPWLRVVIQYAADDWLFIEKYMIKVDGQTFNIPEESYGEIKTDNGSGGIWEWLDRKVGYSEYQIIKAVANGKDVKIRFDGKDYYKDKAITAQQKIALKNVLDAYEALGGDGNF
jgi:hypothetical protein